MAEVLRNGHSTELIRHAEDGTLPPMPSVTVTQKEIDNKLVRVVEVSSPDGQKVQSTLETGFPKETLEITVGLLRQVHVGRVPELTQLRFIGLTQAPWGDENIVALNLGLNGTSHTTSPERAPDPILAVARATVRGTWELIAKNRNGHSKSTP